MLSNEPLDHILRSPLPWRRARHTECGRPEHKVHRTIERHEYEQRLAQWGQRRTAFTVCQTCAPRYNSAETWDRSPIEMMHRETQRVGPWSAPDKPTEDQRQLIHELRALAALVEAHREEFDQYMAGLEGTISLAERRREPVRWAGRPS